MIVGYVEPSGESAELARWEVRGAAEALGGRLAEPQAGGLAGLLEVILPDLERLAALAGRVALARRSLIVVGEGAEAAEAVEREGRDRKRASFRRVARPQGPGDEAIRALGRRYVEGGGVIDLEGPERRYWVATRGDGTEVVLREVAAVDRASAAARAMPKLPFRRPVALPPRLARAAANVAAIRPGETVIDPFVGTGALLAEAALLGAHVYGLDSDPVMLRGALRNLAHLGVAAQALVEGDARVAELPAPPRAFDVLLTDPPYGRSSASVGGPPDALVREVLGRWEAFVRPKGRIVVVMPGGPPVLGKGWVETCRVPVRVHRSLTREFRRYDRAA